MGGIENNKPDGVEKKSSEVPVTEEEIRNQVEKTAKDLASSVVKKEKKAKKEKPPQFTFENLKSAFYLNEYGDADIAISIFKNKFVRDNSTGDFYKYKEHRWHRCLNREQEAEFREVSEIYGKEAAACNGRMKEAEEKEDDEEKRTQKKWRENFNARAKALRGNARIRNVLNLATAGEGSLGISGQEWNLDHRLLPVANGVVDLETGKLRDGVYSDWFSFGSPIEYKGYRHQGDFVPDLLNKILCGNDTLVEYMHYLLGFACTGIQTKDFFVAYGPLGNNGKSVLFDWVGRILGEFAANIPVELIYEDRFGRDPDKPSPQILRLRGLRLAVMSEPASNKKLSTAKVKYLTSGTDKIGARNLNEKIISDFWPTHTSVMHGNEVPRVVGHHGPFYDRLRLIPCRARFVLNDDEVDESNYIFKQIPRIEMDRILREHDTEMLSFLVRCARKALALGDMPPPPDAVKKETKAFRDEEDLVGRYLRQCTEKNYDAQEQAKDVYQSFCYFCREELGLTSKQTPSQKAISADLRAQPHIECIESRTIYYRGISINPEWRAPKDFK
jgi:putative DNA primase/helicase